MLKKKWLVSLALAGAVSVMTACGTPSDEGSPESQQTAPAEGSTAEGEAPAMPEPDLEGIPDVVASVNGTDILKEEYTTIYEGQFQQSAMQSQMSGQEVDQDQLKTQVVENMIGTELLIQEAGNRGIEASEEAKTETLNGLAESNQLGSPEEFIAKMGEQGMDEKEVNAQLETQVQLDQLIAEETGEVKPTEEELKAAYEEAKTQQEQMGEAGGEAPEVPPFEELRPQLEEQFKAQKESEVTEALVTSLREKADVTINL
ncbi:SurA N-terminal domain-containing protein [Arthrobacter sp. H5]|uniref:SurA N-terminal domain-containing protein n=1 Tax=Arthrobacter sp. H5 TaxID=1267973 RepID=UPI0004B6D45A|nr:SurA N-terminal domain-containing protein [Arthrobacter sp. H5]